MTRITDVFRGIKREHWQEKGLITILCDISAIAITQFQIQ